jgi:hypothetical protein
MARRGSARSKALQRLLPGSYAAVALLVVAFILPSALRPPPDTTQSGSEYSPDAPPNSKAQSLIRTQLQPGSSTAGQDGGPGATPTPSASPTPPAATTPPKTGAGAVSCATNWSPPRQWDSVYAPPCQAAFTGGNGGTLDPGVTSTNYNVVVSFYGQQQTDGWITDASARSSSQLRTLNGIQKYLNKHAMTYNRKLRLAYATEASATAEESTQRSNVTDAIAKYHPIVAAIEGTAAEVDEYSKNKVITESWLGPIESFYQKHKPYAWNQVSPTYAAEMTAEWACKQLKGRPPIAGVRTGNAGFDASKPRTWGTIQIPLAWANSGSSLLAGLKTCGIQPLDQAPGVQMAQDIQQALLRLQSEGVTSVILNTDILTAMLFEIQASQIGYYPEWITTGWSLMEGNAYLVRNVPRDQLSHTFGLNLGEVNLAPEQNECYRAVASVDPGFVAHPLYCHLYWQMLNHAVAAVQLNGPKLTRESLARTYPELPPVPNDARSRWAMIGGFDTPARRAWPEAANIYWWDPDRLDADGVLGTYAYADCGRRFAQGQFPSRPANIFTRTGFVTGRTFYGRCTPVGGRASASVQGTATTIGLVPQVSVPPRRRMV